MEKIGKRSHWEKSARKAAAQMAFLRERASLDENRVPGVQEQQLRVQAAELHFRRLRRIIFS